MRPRLLLLLLFLLPGLALGPGWNLRVCAGELLGLASCCDAEVVKACCPDQAPAAQGPGWRGQERSGCEGCCLDIDTSGERLAPTPAPGTDLERTQLAVAAVPTHEIPPSPTPRTALAPRARPPAPPGRAAPLPLRI